MINKVDPITLAVLINNLHWLTEEMNEYLVRSAFSTNIKIRRDCSCGLYTKNGDLLSQGEFIPVHLGVMAQTLKEVLKDYPLDSFDKGDQIIHNDPYRMGSHLWDIMIFKPIFFKDKIIAFTGNLAHHIDIGGSPLLSAVPTIFEEGLRIPPIKIIKRGILQEDILKIITNNVRTPFEVKGDLYAQTAANFRGEQRIIELSNKYGDDVLIEYFEEILDYSEKGMRKAIADLGNQESEFEDFIESDGVNNKLIRIKTKIKIEGEGIYVDFEGSGEPGYGGVISTWALTHSAAYCAIKSVLAPYLPTNGGAYRPIHLIKPKVPSIVNAEYPHSVGDCTSEPAQRIVDVIIGAFYKIVPKQVCACDGDWPSSNFVGVDPRNGKYSVFPETYGCGCGAKYNDSGADGHQTHMTNTANAPVEIIELEHPLKIIEYSLVDDSGGAGKHRGGVGICRIIENLVPMSISTTPFRPSIKPYGLEGGEGGQTDLCGVIVEQNKIVPVVREARKGLRTIIKTSGGGGWGNPLEADYCQVEWDVLNGYVSIKSAKDKYGCIINPKTLKIDKVKSDSLREKLKNKLVIK